MAQKLLPRYPASRRPAHWKFTGPTHHGHKKIKYFLSLCERAIFWRIDKTNTSINGLWCSGLTYIHFACGGPPPPLLLLLLRASFPTSPFLHQHRWSRNEDCGDFHQNLCCQTISSRVLRNTCHMCGCILLSRDLPRMITCNLVE